MHNIPAYSRPNPNNTQQQASSAGGTLSLSEGMKKLEQENQELKRKIEKLENIVSVTSPDTAHVKALVPLFSGDDTLPVHVWIEKLENAFEALKLTAQQQLVAGCELLTGTAAIFLKTISLTEYEDLKEELLKEFGHRTLSSEAILKKLGSHRLETKSLLRYTTEMVEMADGYNVPEEDLVDLIIDGFEDASGAVVMLYRVETIAELKRLLPRYEKRREVLQAKKAPK